MKTAVLRVFSSGCLKSEKGCVVGIQIEKASAPFFEMRYFKFGHGEKTLVILPGLSIHSVMDSAEAVEKEYALMEDEFTVYVFDRRTEIPANYSIGEMARDTAKAMRILHLSDTYLFGASQGGMIAMEMALQESLPAETTVDDASDKDNLKPETFVPGKRNPHLIKKLVLGNTASETNSFQSKVIEEWIEKARKKDTEALYLDFGKRLYSHEVFESVREMLVTMSKSVTEADLKRFIILAGAAKAFNVTRCLKKIMVPTLIIGSQDDGVLGAESTLVMIKAVEGKSNFEHYIYNGYGHAAFDTAPDYRERLLNFYLG